MNRTLTQFDPARHAERSSQRGIAQQVSTRDAFTLVELLVVVVILSILATLSVAAFRGNDEDRIKAAASTFKNALEGARSRALKSGQIRGLRLITDPNDNRIVTSFQYIGAPEPNTGLLQITGINPTDKTFQITQFDSDVPWDQLFSRKLLNNTLNSMVPNERKPHRIKIGETWYHVIHYNGTGDTMTVSGHYPMSYWDSSSSSWMVSSPDPVRYELELTPTLLPNSEPILLTAQTCIDLDGSVIPWRPNPWHSADVTTGPGYSAIPMDILFSSNGTAVGDLATYGLVHFRIANFSDLILSRAAGRTTPDPDDIRVVANPEKGHRAVSVFPKTGNFLISEINTNTGAPAANDFNSETVSPINAYSFAIRGKEAN